MIKKLGFIGAGNVAWHLSKAFQAQGLELIQIWSRTQDSADRLATEVGAEAITKFSDMNQDIDLWIISVPDDAIETVLRNLMFIPKALVHTCGSISIEVLHGKAQQTGVLYPLQTFSKMRKVDMTEVPFCLETESEAFFRKLRTLAQRVSNNVFSISSGQRADLHLAAVFTCNFTNALFGISEQLLSEKDIPVRLLHPLMKETIEKAIEIGARKAQTGPALRNDQKIMNKHRKMLAQKADLEALYNLLSKIIRK
jgi:predicted short-subunit dehydrogenase-like oxidoreductase (DUF2520 family)